MFVNVSLTGKNSIASARLFPLLALSFLMLIQVCPGVAKTLSVPESSPTIKGALLKAQSGDIVLVSCGTYFEHDIVLKPGVALWSGTLQPGCVTIDAQGKGRVFRISNADTNTALVGFTLRGGLVQSTGKNQGGAILCINSSPRISNCVFEKNSAQKGGAVFIDQNSFPVLTNCIFDNNEALTLGGGAYCHGTVAFRQCVFSGNSALMGGGLFLKDGAKVNLANCSLRGNSAGNTGGGLHLEKSQCRISKTVFSDNWGGIGGNALSSRDSDLRIRNSTLFRNRGDDSSGVLALQGKLPQIQNCIIAFSQSTVLRTGSKVPILQGCNLYGNENGDWVNNLGSSGNKDNNISLDPKFCAPEYGNFSLKKSSACLPENNPSGNKSIVGAFGPGCV